MKQKLSFLFLTFFIFIFSIPATSYAITDESQEKLLIDALKTTLARSIDDAIVGYYGKREKSFGIYDMQIKEIKRMMQDGYSFLVKVQVETFEGPHNPPYGREIITLEIGPGGVNVLQFEHKDIP